MKKNFDNHILLQEKFNINYTDIIVLGECFQIELISSINIPGFDTFYNQGAYNITDGVLIMIKHHLNATMSHFKLLCPR